MSKRWEIIVIDFGIGISSEIRKSIYQPFVRGRNTVNVEGTGLGLMIINMFVKLNKGKIFFKSLEGKGTIFVIQFPC